MKRVAIDIDEVLVSFVRPMAKFRGYRMPTAQKYPYVYKDMFNITETQSRNMVHDFYESRRSRNLDHYPVHVHKWGIYANTPIKYISLPVDKVTRATKLRDGSSTGSPIRSMILS